MVSRWLLALTCALSVASADLIFSMDDIQQWEEPQTMQLQLTSAESASVFNQYGVLPLTTAAGLNQSDRAREATNIDGSLVWVTTTNYNNISTPDVVAYLCCDNNANTSNISPSDILTGLMNNEPVLKAILLYSAEGNCCGLQDSNPPFRSIFTMTDRGEATETLRQANSAAGGSVRAVISGNGTSTDTDTDSNDNQGGSNSAVAMSILYSITGLITLLFLIIIATGAIRAHRYPERYGPRSGDGGGARQSRAKGLARAVLETIPIVKFGAPTPPKDDPALELESQASVTELDGATGARLSAIAEEPRPGSTKDRSATSPIAEDSPAGVSAGVVEAGDVTGRSEDEYLGCSICTEDFKVGEDVRVLPCNHKFHPTCIDPWLVDVSGTCPLCRLDLRPHNSSGEETTDDTTQLPPPLEHEAGDGSEQYNAQRTTRRSSRLLDLHRLRHASVEERLEILRRHRSQQQESSFGPNDGPDTAERHSHHTRLSDRLREKFRIKTTRTQYPPAPP